MPSKKTASKKVTKRDKSLDLLRGIAVLLMIITHVNGIFYSGSFAPFNLLSWLGATVCFTIFLFVSASVTGIKIELGKINKEKMASRLVKFLLAYYITAFILVALRFGIDTAISDIGNILLFQVVPEFIEFILAFIIYGLIVTLIPKSALKFMTDAKVLIPLTFIVFIASKVLYLVETDSELLISLKFLFTGHKELHGFGVLSYFPVFALGLWWGGNKIRSKGNDSKSSKIILFSSFYLYLFMILGGISNGNRFPPSFAFMLFGIAFSLTIILLSPKIMEFKRITSFGVFMGQNAFNYYILHVILLYIIAYFIGWSLYVEVSSFLILIVTITFSTLIIDIQKRLEIRLSERYHH